MPEPPEPGIYQLRAVLIGISPISEDASSSIECAVRWSCESRIAPQLFFALLNSQHPELSGHVLSLLDELERPQDGFLRAHEVYNLKLTAAPVNVRDYHLWRM